VFSQEHLQKIEEGIHLFNQQKYWECHEVLEDLWLEDRQDPHRCIYWAVIQVAATCIHYRDGNILGAQGMIAKSKEKFRRCRDLGVVSDLLLRMLDWGKLESLVMAIPDGNKSTLDDFISVFNFRFKNFL
jgi:uncharacterized protein